MNEHYANFEGEAAAQANANAQAEYEYHQSLPAQDEISALDNSGNLTLTSTGTPTWTGNGAGTFYSGTGEWTTTVWPPQTVTTQPMSEAEEVALRERAIERTISLFGSDDVDLEIFCAMLDSIYHFMRWGTPIIVKETNKVTNNNN